MPDNRQLNLFSEDIFSSDPEEQKEIYNELQRKNYETLLQAYADTFNSPNGQEVLRDLRNCFFERTSLDDSVNIYKTVANEGKRFVVIHILHMIEEANTYARG